LSVTAFAQARQGDESLLKVGYAVVTPDVDGLIVFETFERTPSSPSRQATVFPGRLVTKASFFASADITFSNSVGVAVANPGKQDAHVTMTLRRNDGTAVAQKVLTIRTHQQVSQFVSELFSDVPDLLQSFNGTIGVLSDYPVVLVGLRFRGDSFSSIPITSLFPSSRLPIPELVPGVGGAGAVILPQFVADGGWASEIVAINPTAFPMKIRVDVFKQDGSPLVTNLNQQSASSFLNLSIPPGGVLTLAP